MYIWARCFDIKGDGPDELPLPLRVCNEIQTSPGYISRGCLRQSEVHCIFHYCLAGRGMVKYKGVEHEVLPEHGFLCVISDPDMEYFYPPSGSDKWEFIWFAYQGGGSSALTKAMIDAHGPVFSLPADSFQSRQLRQFGRSVEVPVEMNRYEGARLVYNLLLTLGDACESTERTSCSLLVSETMEMLRSSSPPVDVNELSVRQNVSREHLSRIFRKETGITLKDALTRRKSLAACQQLLNTDVTVEELAKDLGYSSTSNFCRMFRKYTGVTPATFRKEQKRLAGHVAGIPSSSALP